MINNKICGLLGLARRAGKLSFGTESCIQEIEKNKIKLIIIFIFYLLFFGNIVYNIGTERRYYIQPDLNTNFIGGT